MNKSLCFVFASMRFPASYGVSFACFPLALLGAFFLLRSCFERATLLASLLLRSHNGVACKGQNIAGGGPQKNTVHE